VPFYGDQDRMILMILVQLPPSSRRLLLP